MAVYGCWWAWWAVVVLNGGRGPLLALVGCCGGSSLLVACPGRVVVVVLWFHVVVGLYSLCRVAVVGSLLSCVIVLCVSKVGLEVREVSTYCGVLVQNNEQRTMVIVRRLVATSLTATWHLDCVSTEERREGDVLTHLMWTATTLCVFIVNVEKGRDRGWWWGEMRKGGKKCDVVTDSHNFE